MTDLTPRPPAPNQTMWATYHDAQALFSYCELAVTAFADSADSISLDDQCIGVQVSGGGTPRATLPKFRIRDTWLTFICLVLGFSACTLRSCRG